MVRLGNSSNIFSTLRILQEISIRVVIGYSSTNYRSEFTQIIYLNFVDYKLCKGTGCLRGVLNHGSIPVALHPL